METKTINFVSHAEHEGSYDVFVNGVKVLDDIDDLHMGSYGFDPLWKAIGVEVIFEDKETSS